MVTGLHRRVTFDERLSEEFSRAQRFGLPLSLIVVALGNLKSIDETAGHGRGIAVLRWAADTISETCREFDVPCRMGDGEIAVLLPSTPVGGAEALAGRISRKLLGALDPPKMPEGVMVELSVGCATLPKDAATPFELVMAAEEALCAAKRGSSQRLRQIRAA